MGSTSKKIAVDVERREGLGKNNARRVRAAGKVPGNVYGLNMDAFTVSVDPRRVEEVLRLDSGRNTIFNLALDGGKQSREVMLRELQRDPVTGRLIHVDFVRVDPTRELNVSIPVHLLGTAEGVKNEGGLLDFVHRQINVACLPGNIPESFDVDVSQLHVGQHVSVADLTAAEGVRFIDEPDTIIATVALAKAEVVAEDEAAAEEGEAVEGEAEAATEEKKDEGGGE